MTGGARTRGRRIMRSTASCTTGASCTDGTGHGNGGARCAGIIWRAGPRTGPRWKLRTRPVLSLPVISPGARCVRPPERAWPVTERRLPRAACRGWRDAALRDRGCAVWRVRLCSGRPLLLDHLAICARKRSKPPAPAKMGIGGAQYGGFSRYARPGCARIVAACSNPGLTGRTEMPRYRGSAPSPGARPPRGDARPRAAARSPRRWSARARRRARRNDHRRAVMRTETGRRIRKWMSSGHRAASRR